MATLFLGSRILDDFTLADQREVATALTVNGQRVIEAEDWQKWLLAISTEIEFNGRKGFLRTLEARRMSMPDGQPFPTPMPQFPGYEEPGAVTTAAATAGATTVTVNVSTRKIQAASFFTFAGQSKVYMAGNEVPVGASRPMSVYPAVREAVGPGTLDFTPNVMVIFAPQSIRQVRIASGIFAPTYNLEEWLA